MIIAICALVFCLFGCSGNSQPQQVNESDPMPLEVSSGFSQDGNNIEVGILIKNPNDDLAFENASLSIVVKDADGKVLDSDNEYKIGTVLPGEEFGFGVTQFSKNEMEAKTVDVSISSDDGIKSDAVSGVTIKENTVTTARDFIFVTVDGEYENNTELSYDSIMFGALMFDAGGNIICGGLDEQYDASKGVSTFSIIANYPENAPDPSQIKNYAHVYSMN